MTQEDQPPELPKVGELLPKPETLSVSLDEQNQSSLWSPEELGRATRAFIRRFIKSGFRMNAAGYLEKGHGRSHVEVRPHAFIDSSFGTPQWNPVKDAVALRMGAEFVRPGVYRLGGLLLDAMGSCLNPDLCLECGSHKGVGEYKYNVRIESRNPNARPWDQAWTYCRSCTNAAEFAAYVDQHRGQR